MNAELDASNAISFSVTPDACERLHSALRLFSESLRNSQNLSMEPIECQKFRVRLHEVRQDLTA